MSKDPQAESPYHIQVLDRVFRILDLLADQSAGATLVEITRAAGLHKSTAHRLMTVLEQSRYVEKNSQSGCYRLGSRVMELGLSAAARLDVYEVARPHMQVLVEETGETAHLAVLRDSEIVSLLNVDSRQTIRTPGVVGARRPAYCTALGKAILAFLSREQQESYLRGAKLKSYTPGTICSIPKLRMELKRIRASGYALDDEEWETGLRCIGAPVRDNGGIVVAAVSIDGPLFRISEDRYPGLSSAVMRAADRISASLGYRANPGRAATAGSNRLSAGAAGNAARPRQAG